MRKRKLFWHLFPYIFVVIVVSLILVTIYASREMKNIHLSEISKTLEYRARILEVQIKELIINNENIEIDNICKQYGQLTETRITVVDIRGNVLGDSDKDPLLMENHGLRPEAIMAYDGKIGFSTRYSNTIQRNMKYVALPIYNNGEIVGLIRTSLPVADIEEILNKFYLNVILGGAIILLIAAFVSYSIFKRFTNPLGELMIGAERFASGKLNYKLQPSNIDEIASLTGSMKHMADDLNTRIKTIIDQRNEREAILSSMTEGILALDSKHNIITLNEAASSFFELNPQEVSGNSIYKILRIPDLHNLVDETSASNTTVEKEFNFLGEDEKCFQSHGTLLRDKSGKRIGMVLVFNDITRLKRLESIRRDFVANVSHELKTPITAILGSAETLLDFTSEKPEENKRFLEMIVRQSERLNSLVDDLLTLARVESDLDEQKIELSQLKLVEVLNSAITLCKTKSESLNIEINCECESSIVANINSRQMEQAVTNLIDNAIKYSKAGDSINVNAVSDEKETVISVIDQGSGIDEKYIPRLFERFYRVEKGRSRDMGGTGLGLAIVKHIVLAHKGYVSVESIPFKGSTFRIHLPLS